MGARLRPLAAEFFGTFSLVFVASGAVLVDEAKSQALGLVGVALAPAALLALMVTALVRVSGAHFNPAVTFGLWLANKIELKDAGLYIVTQLLAAVAAALLLKTLFPSMAGELTSYGLTRIAGDIDIAPAILIEAFLTLFLISAMFGTVVSSDASPAFGGLGVGLAVLLGILVGGPLTGAAMNPARAFGPALVSMDWVGHAVYWIGPLLGAAAGALLWGKILLPEQDR